MKKAITILLCVFCLKGFAQDTGFYKTFPGNDSVTYFTNSKILKGLTFYHKLAKDTANAIFYVDDYRYSDLKISPEKIKIMNARPCLEGFKSKPGDLIFTMDGDSEIIFYYHMHEEDLLDVKIN